VCILNTVALIVNSHSILYKQALYCFVICFHVCIWTGKYAIEQLSTIIPKYSFSAKLMSKTVICISVDTICVLSVITLIIKMLFFLNYKKKLPGELRVSM